jgi:MraZ protein
MALKGGEYPATLDDKGRVSIPSRFREEIPENVLVLIKGLDQQRTIWAHTPQTWEKVYTNLMNAALPSYKKTAMLHHRLLSSCEVELDKAGRIAIPQKLRDYAELSKDCVLASNGNRIEIWDARHYTAYEQEIDEQIMDILEEMGPINLY